MWVVFARWMLIDSTLGFIVYIGNSSRRIAASHAAMTRDAVLHELVVIVRMLTFVLL
jgi:hypothetical protein